MQEKRMGGEEEEEPNKLRREKIEEIRREEM